MNSTLYEKVIEAAIEVHAQLGGPGLMESVYESALCHELSLRKINTQRQLPIPVVYKKTVVREPFFLDILVENELIIEVKASGFEYPFYQVQLLTYLKLMGKEKGLLINFGKTKIRDGIKVIENRSSASLTTNL